MNSATSHAIKHREVPKDVFYTPLSVVKKHVSMIPSFTNDHWQDPFAGKQVQQDNFPTENKSQSEIEEGLDFFEKKEPVDIICSNPPQSLLDKVLKHSIELKPRVISYLLLEGKMTPRRMEFLNQNGQSMTGMQICKVYQWQGMAVAQTFVKSEKPTNEVKVEQDRIVHR